MLRRYTEHSTQSQHQLKQLDSADDYLVFALRYDIPNDSQVLIVCSDSRTNTRLFYGYRTCAVKKNIENIISVENKKRKPASVLLF